MIENRQGSSNGKSERFEPVQIPGVGTAFTITQLQSSLENRDITPDGFYSLISDKEFIETNISRIGANSQLPFTTAVSLAHASYEDYLSCSNRENQLPYEQNALSVDLFARMWRNCTESEAKMRESLQSDAIVEVNEGRLVVKGEGYLTALCIDTFVTDRSTFIKGVWYSPVDMDTRDRLRNALENHDLSLKVTEGLWIPTRGAYTADSLLESTRSAVGL